MRWDVGGSRCRSRGRPEEAKQDWGREGWFFSAQQVLQFCTLVHFLRENFRSGNSLYELLDIPKDSTPEDIKKKYRRLALKYDNISYADRHETNQSQVSSWQKSWQCGGRGDVQEDQQCQRHPEVCHISLTNVCGYHQIRWYIDFLLCSQIPKRHIFSAMRRRDSYMTSMAALVYILLTRSDEKSIMQLQYLFPACMIRPFLGWWRLGGNLVLCSVQVVQGSN